MRMRSLMVVKLAIVAAIATCLFAGTASAQPVLKGTFTLPYEVRWGKAVLPAGHYSITIDNLRRPALVSTLTGEGRALVMALSVDDAMKDQPTALLVTQSENERIVRSFNWREGNKTFVYTPFTKAERKRLADLNDVEAVPILVAQK